MIVNRIELSVGKREKEDEREAYLYVNSQLSSLQSCRVHIVMLADRSQCMYLDFHEAKNFESSASSLVSLHCDKSVAPPCLFWTFPY